MIQTIGRPNSKQSLLCCILEHAVFLRVPCDFTSLYSLTTLYTSLYYFSSLKKTKYSLAWAFSPAIADLHNREPKERVLSTSLQLHLCYEGVVSYYSAELYETAPLSIDTPRLTRCVTPQFKCMEA